MGNSLALYMCIIKQGNVIHDKVIHKYYYMMEFCHTLIDQIQTFCFSKYLSAWTFYRGMIWLWQFTVMHLYR